MFAEVVLEALLLLPLILHALVIILVDALGVEVVLLGNEGRELIIDGRAVKRAFRAMFKLVKHRHRKWRDAW